MRAFPFIGVCADFRSQAALPRWARMPNHLATDAWGGPPSHGALRRALDAEGWAA